ncbi:type II toxin-antitoxin system Phd/YefM family antitoxin [Streptomyces sp. NPDC005529]|uniref:type II toxin-antitoxin system Phd/YefM family antitoxin n=1 Tax=unclassified Streptomyces TaxID=2593676 RepID=UPI0033B57AF6
MEATAREFNQRASQILSAAAGGKTVTVTRNGVAVAKLVPIGGQEEVPSYPVGPMGDIDLPDLSLPDLSDEYIEQTLGTIGG